MKISRRSFIIGGAATVAAAGVTSVLPGCNTPSITKSGIDPKNFETKGVATLGTGLENITSANVPTKLYTITNKKGTELCITNFGARIVSLCMESKNNSYVDVVLGFDNLKQYADFSHEPKNYYGAVISRYGNRIGKSQFSIDGNSYKIDTNENDNCLHSGKFGAHNQTWEEVEFDNTKKLKLKYTSPDGEMGFPGELTMNVTYTLSDDNVLGIYYEAGTTKATPVNMTNHTYWNVSGNPSHPIIEDKMYFSSKQITPVDKFLIPTGELKNINKNEAFDFFSYDSNNNRALKKIGDHTKDTDEQIKYGHGFDMNFVILDKDQLINEGIKHEGKFDIVDDGSKDLINDARFVAQIDSEESGLSMEIHSTEPGIQFFDGNNLDGTIVGKGKKFEKFAGMALETQHYPDCPNKSNFPNTILRPGEKYQSKTEYKFNKI